MEKQRHLRTEVLCQSFVGHPPLSSVIICTHLSPFMYYHLSMWVPCDIFTISSLCQSWGDGVDCHVPKSNIEFQETFSTFVLNLSCDYADDTDDYSDDEIWQTLWGGWNMTNIMRMMMTLMLDTHWIPGIVFNSWSQSLGSCWGSTLVISTDTHILEAPFFWRMNA